MRWTIITIALLLAASCDPNRSALIVPRERPYPNDCREGGRGVVEISEYGHMGTVRFLDTADVWYRCGDHYEVYKGGGMPDEYEVGRFHLSTKSDTN